MTSLLALTILGFKFSGTQALIWAVVVVAVILVVSGVVWYARRG